MRASMQQPASTMCAPVCNSPHRPANIPTLRVVRLAHALEERLTGPRSQLERLPHEIARHVEPDVERHERESRVRRHVREPREADGISHARRHETRRVEREAKGGHEVEPVALARGPLVAQKVSLAIALRDDERQAGKVFEADELAA